ncbi:MAG: hypothetical protein LBH11_03350 [Propionibacteriaceae bacterium]|jgi:hypothetical protein|nr:hypothetical protein [Propionibacteriaceae bacterium]
MTPWATQQDVEARIGRPVSPAEADQVKGLLDEATVLLRGWLAQDFPDTQTPDEVRIVCSRMVARVLERGSGLPVGATGIQAAIGPFQQGLTFSADTASGGVWIAAADRLALKRFRTAKTIRLQSQQTGRFGSV